MDKDVRELQQIILGRAARVGPVDSAMQTQQQMQSFVDGIKMPTKPPVYKHPAIPPVTPVAVLAKHR